jgi:hypothetical protein
MQILRQRFGKSFQIPPGGVAEGKNEDRKGLRKIDAEIEAEEENLSE